MTANVKCNLAVNLRGLSLMVEYLLLCNSALYALLHDCLYG